MDRFRACAYWLVVVLLLVGFQIGCGSPVLSTVSISPSTSTLFASQTVQFSASSSGGKAGFIWSANEQIGGSATAGYIDADGLYTAPPNVASPLTVTVTATLIGAPTRSASASLTVQPLGVVSGTANPLVANYAFTTFRDAMVSVDFGPDTHYGLKTWAVPAPTGGGTVNVLVAGMRQFSTYHMRARAEFPDGTALRDLDRIFTTGGLPAARVPQVTVTNPDGLSPTRGVQMFHLTPGASQQVQVAAMDNSGNIVWYYDALASSPQPIQLLPNGHFLINLATGSTSGTGTSGDVREIDLVGNIIRRLNADDLNGWLTQAGISLQVFSIHHDVLPLPNGHLILLVNHYRTFVDLPGFPGPITVLGDALVDLDENLTPVWVWDSFDHLDINRHPMNFPDWTHSNAILYSPDDGNLLLSIRHQSWIVKIDYQDGRGTGDVLWRLGYQGDFTLTTGGDPAAWFYAQHLPEIISPASAGIFEIVVFDDGNNRVLDNTGTVCGTPGAQACYTRVPIFQVNEATKTAGLLWQYNASPEFTVWGGNAQRVGDMRVGFDLNVATNPNSARYMEVTQDPDPQTVLQMEVTGQAAYRIVHLPSLYPGVQW